MKNTISSRSREVLVGLQSSPAELAVAEGLGDHITVTQLAARRVDDVGTFSQEVSRAQNWVQASE
jgi:hypothetical protein